MRRTIRWPSARVGVATLVLALSLVFARGVPWGDVAHQLRHASAGWLAAAVLAIYLGLAVRVVVWWGFVREVGVRSIALAVRGVLVMAALNAVGVGTAGEVGRAVLVTRESGVSGTAIVSTIALDHVLITLVHGLAATALGFLLPLPETLERYRLLALGTLIALGVAMALVLRVPHRAEVEQRRAGTVRRHVREFAATMKHVMTGRRLAISLPLLALYWCLGLTAIHCAAHALDVPISIGVSTAAFLAVSAGGMVQSTPGNIGVTQMAYAGTAHLLGVPVDQAVGVALLYQAVQTVPVLLVAIPVLGASLRSYGGDALTEPAELRASRATAGVQLQPRQSGAAPRPPRRSPPS